MAKRIVIIGNGIAGITAARNLRKGSDSLEIVVISSESKHFFSRTALMYIYMGHMKYEHTKPYEDWFWEKNRIELIYNYVEKVITEENRLFFSNGESLQYDTLIIASGSEPNKFGWPGQDLKGVQGLYSLQDLELMEENTQGIKNAVIVGGGLIGVEMAEMLKTRDIDVTFLVREKYFWSNVLPRQEGELVGRHMREHGVNLILETELEKINGENRVKSVTTKNGTEIPCDFVGLTVGVHPNISFLKDSGIEMEKGVLIDEYMRTNIEDIYAIGDCVQHKKPLPGRAPVEQVWYTGRIMGETVARNITGDKKPYSPGIWFNSAKFFDIEYQTYGYVPNSLSESQQEFYWENEVGNICLHFVFDKESLVFLGINTFGIRLRHQVFDRWISENRDIKYVIANLKEANFDPEFFHRYEREISNAFNGKFPELSIPVKAKKNLMKQLFS